ncbi:MAG TPA: hypothetical protein VF715_14050 [Thermoleophilaceae bacterium]
MDLGLRDVGVETDPRRHLADFGRFAARLLGVLVSLFGIGAGAAALGAPWLFLPLVWTGTVAFVLVTARRTKRSRVSVVKVGAAGWLPPQRRLRDMLHRLRDLLAAGEAVLGDGVGRAVEAQRSHGVLRLIAATDRRLLVVGQTGSPDGAPLIDAPYDRVTRFGFEWKQLGLAGELSLDVAGAGTAAPETHVIGSIAPAHLVSIAQTLRSHGVPADDPAAVAAAERAWDEARGAASRREAAEPRESRGGAPAPAPMTGRPKPPAFDRGLWKLLRLAAGVLYINSFGVGLGVARNPVALLLLLPLVCGVCGYVAGTMRSLAYLIPLNLLLSPTFFFADPGDVLGLMLTLSVFAAAGLCVGVALRRARHGAPPEPAPARERPRRGTLQEALSGPGLIRLSGIVLAGILTLVMASAAAGLELSMVSLAVEEMTREQKPVDGRSNLTGGAASLTYTRGPDLRELITDNAPEKDPTDGARWELRSRFTKGYNFVSLASYTYDPPLDDPDAVAEFVAKKDREHADLAGEDATHTERVIDGRRGYVWNHGSPSGFWYHAAWFPHPRHTVRVECMARRQKDRFRRLCAEAVGSLEFR